jgi:hypothetical protein
MRLKSNDGIIVVTRNAYMDGYNKIFWFSKKAITNIISLRNLIQQYRITYDIDRLMFVVHRELESKPNMEFHMHECSLHYYDPMNTEHLAFISTVYENKEGFAKRQIKDTETARALHTKLSYPSMKYFKWVIRSNQIKYCPVTVQDVNVTINIWGRNIAALKGNTTRSKTNPVARDYVKVLMDLLKLHKEGFLNTAIFFMNKIPCLLTLSRKICLAVNHIADRTVPQIFKAFKEMYQYYLQRGFHVTTVHAKGEFAPLKPLIESMRGGPLVNLISANEHVPKIECRIRVLKEISRETRHILPFQWIPKLLTIHIVLNVVKLLVFFVDEGQSLRNSKSQNHHV